jgi:hypothetical protein
MTADQIAAAITDHKLWLEGKGGKCANMQRANMRGAFMRGANMRGANMQGADMRGAFMRGADMRGAFMRGANMRGAFMRGADMRGADMRGAFLQGAFLQGADMQRADMRGADMRGAKIGTGQTVIDILRRATRSDGYEFFLWHCEEDFYITAGCRFFTIAESRTHWKKTRGGTLLGHETMDILRFFNLAVKRTNKIHSTRKEESK